MKVVIAGQGAWGKALYSIISQNTSPVSFWKRGTPLINFDVLVLAVPTVAIRDVLSYVDETKRIYIVNSTKGIEQSSNLLPFQIIKDVFKDFDVEYLSLLGPGFAAELIENHPTLLNLGYVKKESAHKIKKLFETKYLRIQLTSSIKSIELAAAFKNIYAIVAGLSHGLGFGSNTRAELITIALEEFYILSKKLGYTIDSSATPSIIGDLILTCNSAQSRNFRFGTFLVKHSAKDALQKVGATVEGYSTLQSLPYFLKKAKIELPLAHFVSQISSTTHHKEIRKKFLEIIQKL